MKIKSGKISRSVAVAAIAALAGMVIYIITSVTGYLAASSMNLLPVICTIAAVALMCVPVFLAEKASFVVRDLATVAAGALLLVSFYCFVMGRVSLAADVYFIPVNYPASEATALHISIVGVALYLAANIAMITEAFSRKETGR